MAIYPNAQQKLSFTFTDLSGAYSDPSTITLDILKPDGTAETPVTQASMTKTAVGRWYALYTPETTGHYHYRVTTTGTPSLVTIGSFDVEHDPFV
jgi:uncharacterized protein YfaS (alpha-2-macroglobulin family)